MTRQWVRWFAYALAAILGTAFLWAAVIVLINAGIYFG